MAASVDGVYVTESERLVHDMKITLNYISQLVESLSDATTMEEVRMVKQRCYEQTQLLETKIRFF